MAMSQVWVTVQCVLALSLLGAAINIEIPARAQEVPQLSEEQPATTVEASPVQITGVRVETTEAGLQVVLETANALEVPETRIVGNTLIAEIPNAAIAQEFLQIDPIEGIALVRVTSLPDSQVQVAITGTDAPPLVEVTTEAQGLVLAVTPDAAEAVAEDDVIEIVVTGQDEGYNPSSASTATRTDTPLQDIPASIQVIPQQVTEDQGVTGLQDAVRNNVPGISVARDYGGFGAGSFIIRGFEQPSNFRNGFRFNGTNIVDLSNVERIEVLRGPASILFGQLQPGGIVNVVTEQPLREPTYTVEFTAGQFSFYRPEIDFSGPLTENGELLYRLNAVYQNSGSFRDFVNTERVFIAPNLQWNINENTTLNLDFSYLYNDPVFDRGLVALSDGSLPLPINRFLSYPSLEGVYVERYEAGYRLEHRFSEDWQIRNGFFLSSNYEGGSNAEFGSPFALIDDRFISRGYEEYDSFTEEYRLQTDIIGNFRTGSIEHEVLVGFDLGRSTFNYRENTASLPPIDIFDPNYTVSRPDTLPNSFSLVTFTDNLGIYLQDQVSLLDNLIVVIGGRIDFTDQRNYSSGSQTNQSDTAFSPRIGVVYQPIEPISLYASFSQSFNPVVGRSQDNSAFEPEQGTQYEIGIRAEITNNLSATLAAFDITKSNVLTTDLDNPDFSIQIGKQQSQGVEFTLAGEILPGWNIIAGYAYTDARVIEDNRVPEGDFLSNVPRNSANLWTTYEIQRGDFQGLGFGLGLVYVDERQGEFPNSNFQLPNYVRADAALFYRRDNWRAAINVQNLFDVEYYEVSQGRDFSVYPGAPFNVRMSLSFTF
ncbi:TonB-dependent siderophore receptor [Gloeocapsopsis crepidinum LEGE 06123]|uniref:TonB-dependent siderophore receptor n=1 Tax=Gloeocapsopsis crepidinum LEGE 06123 TaxID=588587 RepID=A0ABR9UW57_9CHRO|nr:TonB-dependent siderophore receptor [Gloeocapsopsis crepidinum]MBE9192527.1 TonB-dependent siderophore receptor [Gloeocapsopsis crepidinum LEGE 06123]